MEESAFVSIYQHEHKLVEIKASPYHSIPVEEIDYYWSQDDYFAYIIINSAVLDPANT